MTRVHWNAVLVLACEGRTKRLTQNVRQNQCEDCSSGVQGELRKSCVLRPILDRGIRSVVGPLLRFAMNECRRTCRVCRVDRKIRGRGRRRKSRVDRNFHRRRGTDVREQLCEQILEVY